MSADVEVEDQHCSAQHVEEAGELQELAARVAVSGGAAAAAGYRRFSQIVTKYQEQSQLLDPLLEDLVKPLAGLLHRFALESETAGVDPAAIADTSRYLWLLATVRGYKVVLRFFPNEVANFEPVVALLGRLNAVEAARGVSSPSVWEAQYVLLLWLSMLVLIPFHLSLVDSSLAAGAAGGTAGAAGGAAGAAGGAVASLVGAYPPIVGRILGLCREYLQSPGSVREMAAVVVGRLVTRPDMAGALEEWVAWGCGALQQGGGGGGDPRDGFRTLGAALAFCTIFKLGKRDVLLGAAARVLPTAAGLLSTPAAASNALARKLAVKLIQRIGLVFLRPRLAAWRYRKGRSALLGSGSGAGGGSGSGCAGGEPAAAGAVEGAGVLGGSQQQQQEEQGGEGKGKRDEEAEAEEDVEHAEQIEDVVEALLAGLGDRDTVVRWCAAKGLGRIAGRLPRDLGDEVVGSVLEAFFTPGASDTAWHGGCLAVAELSRRGLLLPERLPAVSPLVARALEYDVRRGPCSVGAHVRDAAAYVCWAFARAYTPEALGAAAAQLAPALITLACYDREVNCRRAAAAAYQECMGRLGNFPHGIDILTAADYFTVSTRSTAYLTVAPYVAGFEEYFEPLARHLLLVKLRHWEKGLRELAASALAALVPRHPAFFVATALPLLLPLVTDNVLEVRHGAVAGIAELLPVLRAHSVALSPELEAAVAGIVPAMDNSKVTRGKGGEVVRSAICRLIETSSAVGLPVSPDQRACLYAHICDNLRHASPEIQQAAAAALGAFALQYLRAPPGGQEAPGLASSDALRSSTAQFLGELLDAAGAPAARRGAALALGALPRWLLEPLRDQVLSGLAAAVSEDGAAGTDARDAETRVNAVRALGQVTLTLLGRSPPCSASCGAPAAGVVAAAPGVAVPVTVVVGDNEGSAAVGPLPEEAAQWVCHQAVEPLLGALEDYQTDNRGDVGSWVREAAMEQLAQLLLLLLPSTGGGAERAESGAATTQNPQQQLPQAVAWVAPRVLRALLRQSMERINRVREIAAAALQALLPAAGAAGVVGAAGMAAALCPLHLEGFGTGEALPAAAALLVRPPLQRALLEGLAFSIGGLDNQLSVAASEALVAAVQRVAEGRGPAGGGEDKEQGGGAEGGSEEARLEQLGEAFVGLWEEAQAGASGGPAAAARRARLATPLLAAADVLLSQTPLRDAFAAAAAAEAEPGGAAATAGAAGIAGSAAAAGAGAEVAAAAPGGLAGRLLACVLGEVRGCTDIPRLHLAAGVLCQLADLPQPLKGSALTSAIALLANRYPKVRRYAAEQLYTALLTFDPEDWEPSGEGTALAPDVDAALELLSETAWDGPLDRVRPARSRLFQCFGLPEPKLVPKRGPGVALGRSESGGGGTAAGAGGEDENASYQALIDRAMRGM